MADVAASDCLKDMRAILKAYSAVVDLTIASTSGMRGSFRPEKEYDELVVSVVGMIAHGAGSLVADLLEYKQPGPETRTCFIISRAVVESMVNCCFVLAGGRPVAETAFRHASQKSYRDFVRESRIGTHAIKMPTSRILDPEKVPGLKEILSEFSTKGGKEKGQWTDKTVPQRIEFVEQKLGETPAKRLHAAYFAIYRHSSEIMHGSFFGAAYFLGFLDRRPTDHTDESIFEHIATLHWLVLFATILSVDAYLTSLNLSYGLPNLEKSASYLRDRLRENPLYAAAEVNIGEDMEKSTT